MSEIIVTPLEWERVVGDVEVAGSYKIDRMRPWIGHTPKKYWVQIALGFGFKTISTMCTTLEDAKAAAQADYTQRILSAIDLEATKAEIAAKDAQISELRAKLFPYADATEISGISWDGKYLIGDKASIRFFHEMKNRGEQIDDYKRAYDQNTAAKDVEIEGLISELEEARDVPWPDWANTILKTLKHYGYDPDDGSGEIDLGEAFKDYLEGVDQEDKAQRAAIAAKDARIAELRTVLTEARDYIKFVRGEECSVVAKNIDAALNASEREA